ncbi:MAG: prepilin-type N-terminal cleavage/methylation domain-containing protein [Xanthomonadales bacterium]|nr:prepilin-type N-terminal cleavage/methylation domain-containing protein [Gammaproteobacteria bacterium]MBT8050679.1 prepilin-type N-terminal cleavage/methylation domain-containing protein [Gammaproteobacteria bacterium]NNJ77941.1 prepilin-type N-terminal cleavage/methylation domain-containing protein [Xanthomonadales bacterium]NNL05052.1 prepilin-type N-terminal cleavage/methylation domain-containing protein [Xanthomonadales bacterium]
MNTYSRLNSLHRSKGVTLVEILLVIALLVIVLSFAIPSMGGATAKADMLAAVENVEYSITSARNSARMNEKDVALKISRQSGDASQVLKFIRSGSADGVGIPDYRLPEDIELVADQASFEFDERGLVRNPGTITLVSRVDESVSETVEVR